MNAAHPVSMRCVNVWIIRIIMNEVGLRDPDILIRAVHRFSES